LQTQHAVQSIVPLGQTPAIAPAAMDIIFINGLRGETVIGIHDSELHHPQPLVIDVAMGLPRSLSCSTDRIEDTIDYGEVRQAVHALLRDHELDLLEAFAERLAQMVLGEFGAHWVRVTVTKPNKFDDVDGVGVTIERVRPQPADPGRRRDRDAEIFGLMGDGMVPGSSARR
jgi:dihydroneopterin aldolase